MSNLIYYLNPKIGHGFASLLTLYDAEREKTATCSICGLGDALRPESILVDWADGSDQIGDFTSATGYVVVKSSIADEFLTIFQGFSKGRVEMYDHPSLHKPARPTKRLRKRVWLPYTGPELVYLKTSVEVPLHERSTVITERECSVCHRKLYEDVTGIEEISGAKRTLRTPGQGIFIEAKLIRGFDFFAPQFLGFTLCTSRVKDFVEAKGYSNLELLVAGELLK